MRAPLRLIFAAFLCWAVTVLAVLPRAVYEMQDLGLPVGALWSRLPLWRIPAAALTQALALAGALLFLTGIVRLAIVLREAGRRERLPRPSQE